MPKIEISAVTPRIGSRYPAAFAALAAGRAKQALGDAGGLADFGVNLVRLPPGGWSSQRHWHTHEDEFVWILEGELSLMTDEGETIMRAGDCAAFAKGDRNGHCLVNKSGAEAVYLEVGARRPEDEVFYSDIDMHATDAGYFHKDGRPY
jgi:uncharacterized cupin superfamily protein